ncbi:Structural maintenance of chromosomes protein 2 [Phlyctochytrium planicorne]|nr:Structural maintenance of chromosomes protein 2 [Phlyctochytrium planicorne]
MQQGFPISAKQLSRVIDGVPTELVVSEFRNAIFVVVNQVGSMGQLLLATNDLGPGQQELLDPSSIQVKTLLGQRDDPTVSIFASQILFEVLKSNPKESRQLLLGLGLVKELRDVGIYDSTSLSSTTDTEPIDPWTLRKNFLDGYIQEIVLEGFKSYASRTVISGWDPEFNAITGLNGSGKSNILDSICFVLGITTLSHVRATNLADLVYKRGQAGITKASVSIVFNNSDPEASPPGWQDAKTITITRQIVVGPGGRNKYMINGHVKTVQDVNTLFHSVQLNVNNPHFLIMQGRITKVLNMKPQEILAMIEEAAGTRMFEDRKEKAVKSILKKDTKLNEITEILSTEIEPKLNDLRERKRNLIEFQRVENDRDRLKRFLIAHEVWNLRRIVENSESDALNQKEIISRLKRNIGAYAAEIDQVSKRVEILTNERKMTDTRGDTLETAANDASCKVVSLETKYNLKQTEVREEKENLKGLEKQLLESKANSEEKRQQVEGSSSKLKSIFEDFHNKQKRVRELEDLLNTLTIGVSAGKGNENGYMDQLQATKRTISDLTTKMEQLKLKMSHRQKELDDVVPKRKRAETQLEGLLRAMNEKQQACHASKKKMETLHPKLQDKSEIENAVQELSASLEDMEKSVDDIEQHIGHLFFSYKSPGRNFDPDDVWGIVAQLVQVRDKFKNCLIALEIAAGGKLYNVVVNSETSATELLKAGQLTRRVTFIPINKINPLSISEEKLKLAYNLAPEKAELAIKTVSFDPKITPAMQYVFGNTLICQGNLIPLPILKIKDNVTAQKLTFDKRILTRSVTIDGDIYDPSGTLSGGAYQGIDFMGKIQQWKNLKEELLASRTKLQALMARQKEVDRVFREWDVLRNSVDLQQHEIALLEKQLETNESAAIIEKCKALAEDIEKAREEISTTTAEHKDALAKVNEIEGEMAEFADNKGAKLKKLQAELSALKTEIAKKSPSVKTKEMELEVLRRECGQNEAEINNISDQIAATLKLIENQAAEANELKESLDETKLAYKKAEKELNDYRKTLLVFDEEYNNLKALEKEKRRQLQGAEAELQSANKKIETLKVQFEESRERLQNILGNNDNSWIQDQASSLGVAGGQFDFQAVDIADTQRKYAQLDQRFKGLVRNVDRSALEVLDRLEKKEASLHQMISTVKKDKKKIEDTISTLDMHKKETLDRTWQAVNKDFGLIFGDLLPNSSAKLVPSDGADIIDGIEIKVNLGGTWKNNLTELSGGQRSLVALALILSLLKYKPAPMYILDEIDSALDESHTQNIGHLLRSRFKGSQFIIVSLKDGMFSNANVLFRTRFKDGVSMVERLQNTVVRKK